MENKKLNNEYNAHSIKVMEGLEAVRKRPGMYIGSTDVRGLHHLIYEVVDNSIDEALAGYCSSIKISLNEDGGCTVEDNGRGIPVEIHPTEGISAAEVVLTKLHAGGKFDKDSYAFSGGLHGVGVSVVNALSKDLKLTIYKDGYEYYQEYKMGEPQGRLQKVGKTEKRGTKIYFLPDETIFKQTVEFSYEILEKRFKEMAFLNKGILIELVDERTEKSIVYKFEKGIISFIEDLTKGKEKLFPEIIYFSHKERLIEVELALQYITEYDEKLISFVNNINTHEGGTHVAGFKSALTSACNKKAKEFKKDDVFSSDDLREGMIAILNVKIAEPQFEGQTKAKLSNYEIKGIVQSFLSDFFITYFEENPVIVKKILAKAELALKAREAARKARELTRKKGGIDAMILPGKLADCSSEKPENNELFIVEGDSAGGSAKTGRDRATQAILGLRGKILNVEKSSIEKMLTNEEIRALIAAIGAGFGNDQVAVQDCRYHKIIIMTDADVDGSHIRTLLLTFFFRYMRPIIEKGFLYIAQPPLYKIKLGKQERYLQNDLKLMAFLVEWANEEVSLEIDRITVPAEEKKELFEKLLFIFERMKEIAKDFGVSFAKLEEYALSREALPAILEQNEKMLEVISVTKTISVWKEISFFVKNKLIVLEENFSIVKSIEAIKLTAKPYFTIQRYKGLGEMNADQLWETAMDPAQRQLLQLKIEDFGQTDYWFNLLMGEEVAPRRQFIEDKAYFVRNLDI